MATTDLKTINKLKKITIKESRRFRIGKLFEGFADKRFDFKKLGADQAHKMRLEIYIDAMENIFKEKEV